MSLITRAPFLRRVSGDREANVPVGVRQATDRAILDPVLAPSHMQLEIPSTKTRGIPTLLRLYHWSIGISFIGQMWSGGQTTDGAALTLILI